MFLFSWVWTDLAEDIWQLYSCVKKLRRLAPESRYEDFIDKEDMAQTVAA